MEDEGVNVKVDTPGCTTTEAIYEDVTRFIDSDTLYVPLKFVGDVES
jgi:hypothetical protein